MGVYYNMFIFNRRGNCLLYKEWNRNKKLHQDDLEEEKKLIFGMLFSLKDLASKLSPLNNGSDTTVNDNLHLVRTKSFTIHHYESCSGILFILNTDSSTPGESILLESNH